MVNLFVAIIVSDIEELKREGNIQETINKAYHIISYGNIISLVSRCYHLDVQTYNTDICVHSICFDCKGTKVSRNIKLELQNIATKNNHIQSTSNHNLQQSVC